MGRGVMSAADRATRFSRIMVEIGAAEAAYSRGMNVHHLELFYYVAKHGGISEAVRKMPYGIQQPAVSGQILQLEETLGLKLFQRRPFHLTPAGRELYGFVEPFFGRLGETGLRLRGESSQRLRLAAPAMILRDHFPNMLEQHRRKFPNLKLQLYDVNQAMAENLLQKQEIDLAFTEIEDKPPAGIKSAIIIKVPLVLLVPAGHKLSSLRQLWKNPEPGETLISLPAAEVISKRFKQGLDRIGVKWAPSVEISSLDLVAAYVSAGLGIGVSVIAPGFPPPPRVKVFPLPSFPPLVIAALWQNRLPPIAESFLQEAKRRALEMQGA